MQKPDAMEGNVGRWKAKKQRLGIKSRGHKCLSRKSIKSRQTGEKNNVKQSAKINQAGISNGRNGESAKRGFKA